nr:leucine zipper domain-containing protein [Streptomyces zingiberis]
MVHRNAPSTGTGRLRLAQCIVDDRWPLRRAAERFQVSPTTAKRWADRYREQGGDRLLVLDPRAERLRPGRPRRAPASRRAGGRGPVSRGRRGRCGVSPRYGRGPSGRSC